MSRGWHVYWSSPFDYVNRFQVFGVESGMLVVYIALRLFLGKNTAGKSTVPWTPNAQATNSFLHELRSS